MLCASDAEFAAADPVSMQAQYKNSKVYSCCDTAPPAKPSVPLIGAKSFTFKTAPKAIVGSSGSGSSPGFRWWHDYSGGR